MSRNLKRLYEYIQYILAISLPLCIAFLCSFVLGKNIQYINLIPEICILNTAICAYTLVTFLNGDLKMNVLFECYYIFVIFNAFMAETIYVLYINNTFVLEGHKENIIFFWTLIILIVINVILTAVVQIHIPENKGKNHNYENKYENYLLNKIDSKQESYTNQKVEVKRNKIVRESEPDTDIFAEMLKNYNETREYFKISKFQSKFSFFVSVFSAIAGFIILAVAIYGIIDNEHLEVSIIAAVSGAITEIASVVVLGIHNKSALQLNYYYDALHENEKLLSAINMADKLNADKREEMYMEIIRKQIDIQPQNREDNK